MTRRRGLTPEERELWSRVTASTRPMPRKSGAQPAPPAAEAGPKRPATRSDTPDAAGAAVEMPPDFRIGARAAAKGWSADPAPALIDHLAAQPVRMDRRLHRQMTRGKLRPEARIDLHGMTVPEAQAELTRFVLNAHAAGRRMVLVITGKGKLRDEGGPIPQRLGILRHHLPMWLHRPPLASVVLQVSTAHARHGGAGAFYVYLRRRQGGD